jgi:hypothetical protein
VGGYRLRHSTARLIVPFLSAFAPEVLKNGSTT